jgi:hypothetical protein
VSWVFSISVVVCLFVSLVGGVGELARWVSGIVGFSEAIWRGEA